MNTRDREFNYPYLAVTSNLGPGTQVTNGPEAKLKRSLKLKRSARLNTSMTYTKYKNSIGKIF